MLQGTATKKGFKDYNLEVQIAPQDLLDWAAWYRKTQLHGDQSLNMVESQSKVQSSITAWVRSGKPKATKPAEEIKFGAQQIDYAAGLPPDAIDFGVNHFVRPTKESA